MTHASQVLDLIDLEKSVSRKLFAFQLERVRHPIEAANNFIIFPKLWNNAGETTPTLFSFLIIIVRKIIKGKHRPGVNLPMCDLIH